MAFNVPMNEDLVTVAVPADAARAAVVWDDYSQPWQVWNVARTLASGLALLLATIGTLDRRGIAPIDT